MKIRVVAIFLATTMLLSVLQTNAAIGDDYFIYSSFNPPGIGDVVGVGGYVADYGNPDVWGDEEQFLYFLSGDGKGYKVKVWLTDYGPTDPVSPGRIEPHQHPENPYATGPIEPRHFQVISSKSLLHYISVSHSEEFYVDASGVYVGAYDYGIHKWNHTWHYMGKIANSPLRRTESLAYNPDDNIWYAGGRYRVVYQLNDTNSDGDFMDETWVSIFTYPSYGGGHHDGMEYVNGYLWISDMTSDIIGQWYYDTATSAWKEKSRFSYTELASVEGMGFGPNDHFWAGSGWGSNSYFYEFGGGVLQKAIEGIPDQCILAGESFETFDLDDYTVGEVDHYGSSGNVNLVVSINTENVVTISYPSGYTGSETITFIAYDDENNELDRDDAEFKVCPVPVVGDIPNQDAPFETFDLDDYIEWSNGNSMDPADVAWVASGMDKLDVSIDSDHKVTVTNPESSSEPETIKFTATVTTCCGTEASDSDNAIFTPNLPPIADAGPNQTLEQTSYDGAEVTLDGSGSYDPNGDPLSYTWTWSVNGVLKTRTGEIVPDVTFPLGVHTVTLTVDDGIASDTDDVYITIQDTTAPSLTYSGEPLVLWSPNHKYHTLDIISVFNMDSSDICDADVGVDDIVIVSVSSDESENTKGKGDGNTVDDIVIEDAQTVLLRAERQGNGNGRVYTVKFKITDKSGNTAYGSVKILVPHDKGAGSSVIDDGLAYEVGYWSPP